MISSIDSLSAWRSLRRRLPDDIGFVPTMGNLHQGHLSLMQRSRKEHALSVVSIFVNPTQFNNASDYVNYPKTLEADITLAKQAHVDYILLPSEQELYPDGDTYQVSAVTQGSRMEAGYRPGHFTGVLTVVLKLLLLVRAKQAYFGEKDYQQFMLVRDMARTFFMDTEIVACPTIRNDFGLPYSSRNNRLTKEQYEQARHFPAIFHSALSCEEIKKQLLEKGFSVDFQRI